MTTAKSQFGQLTVEAITFLFILGVLSMVWPAIIAVCLGFFLLLQGFSAEPEMAVRSWTEIGNLPILFASLRRSGLPAMLS